MESYLIIQRKEDNSEFIIHGVNPKYIYSRKESEIIDMIQNNGDKFYTNNNLLGISIVVIVVDGHIRSNPNETTVDNIRSLPTF
jgi:hypothetical protein